MTLSLIHYARWVILKPDQFPRLSPDQPEEQLKYHYMFFFSNFNGSWDQYVDSFSSAISGGLDKFWIFNIKYPKSIPMLPFHRYITANQIWTDHYYNAYPMASSNDVKSARRVRDALLAFIPDRGARHPAGISGQYNRLLIGLQHDLSQMDANPVVSLAASAVERRLRREQGLTGPVILRRMANKSGNAYGLTVLCPILPGLPKQAPDGMNDQTHADLVRLQLQRLAVNELSPMARVPNTYLSRLWVLDDVPFQGRPAVLEHLKSNYLVFSSNFHGELDDYLRGMWSAVEPEIRAILKYCVGFDRVTDVTTFIDYVKRCQVRRRSSSTDRRTSRWRCS